MNAKTIAALSLAVLLGLPACAQAEPEPVPPDPHPPMHVLRPHGPNPGQMESDRPRLQMEAENEKRAALLDFAREYLPEGMELLEEVRRENPFEGQKAMEEAFPHLMHLKRLKAQDPEAFEQALQEARLDVQARRLSRQIQKLRIQGKEEEAQLPRAQLAKVLEEQFAIREARREKEIRQLERRVAELRGTLEQRRKSRDDIIARHLKQMVGEGEACEW